MSTPNPTGLTFSPGNHVYRLDGAWCPGVTTIIGVIDKPALVRWSATEVAAYVAQNRDAVMHLYETGEAAMVAELKGIPWKKRDDAGARGTTFHDFAERIMLGQEVEVPPEQQGLVESALAFMDDWDVQPVEVEQACGSRLHRYAGTWDLVADHNRGPRAIFDWKSSKRIYASAVFQTNAYAFSEFYGLAGDEKRTADLGIGAAYGVHIRDDGYDVMPLRFGPDIFAEFLHILAVYQINKRAEGNWKKPGSGYVGIALPHDNDAESGAA